MATQRMCKCGELLINTTECTHCFGSLDACINLNLEMTRDNTDAYVDASTDGLKSRLLHSFQTCDCNCNYNYDYYR